MLPEITQLEADFHCTKILSPRWDEKTTTSGLKPVSIRKVLTLNWDWLWNFSFFLPFSAPLLRSLHFDFFLGKWAHDSREVVELWFRKALAPKIYGVKIAFTVAAASARRQWSVGSNIYQLVILLTNFLLPPSLSTQQTERSRHELRLCYQECTAAASPSWTVSTDVKNEL